jgi:hypothetical protein
MTSTHFYLSQLDTSVTPVSATISGVDSSSFTGHATVDINISLDSAKSMFQFYTDSVDINDTTIDDIKYKVVHTTSNNPLNIDLDLASTVSVNPIVNSTGTNNNLTYDYVRYLAEELFATPNGVDLFSNEQELRNNLNSVFKANFNTVLLDLVGDDVVDATGNSPSETILNQVIKSLPGRLENITDLHVADNWYKAPLEADDKLYFLLTVSAAANQHDLTERATPIANRTYLIRATLTTA